MLYTVRILHEQIKLDSIREGTGTGRKLNVHKTFRRHPGRLLNVLCTFNLRPVSTGITETNHCCGKLRLGELEHKSLNVSVKLILSIITFLIN